MNTERTGSRSGQSGFSYLFTLLTVAVLTIATLGSVILGESPLRRDKETELLYAGEQISQAIFSYLNSPNASGLRMPPRSLSDLLWDTRGPQPVAHLRRIYVEPMTGTFEWGEIRDPSGGLIGVFSKKKGRPLKETDFLPNRKYFESAKDYAQWVFSPFPPPSPPSQ